MAPYDYNWSTYGNQQQADNSAYQYQNNGDAEQSYTNNPATTGYQSGTYQQTLPSPADYNRSNLYQQPSRAATATENRAAETLSSLSSQEPSYGSTYNRSSTGVNGTSQGPSYSFPQSTNSANTNDFQQSWQGAQQDQQPDGLSTISRPSMYNFTPAQSTRQKYDPATRTYTAQQSNAAYVTGSHGQNASGQQYARASTGGHQTSDASRAAGPATSHTRAPSSSSRQGMSPRPGTQRGSPLIGAAASAANARVQSMTPTAMQQQARAAPPVARNPSSDQAPVTIDPSHVYDPWPEQQRQAQKAAEERRRLEAEQLKKQEAEKEIAGKKVEEEAKKQRLADEAKKAKEALAQKKPAQTKKPKAPKSTKAAGATGAAIAESTDAMEAEMRSMFEKMRQFNQKDPALLARLWEEERRNHVSTSDSAPVTPDGSKSAKAADTTATSSAAKATPSSGTKLQGSGKPRGRPPKDQIIKDLSKEKTTPKSTIIESATKTSTTQAPPAGQQAPAQALVPVPAQAAPAQTSQPWPLGRKQQLSEVGSKWLNQRPENQGKHITAQRLAELLAGNPSYPDLCKSIEQIGLSLDRSAFAKALLQAVPDLNKPSIASSAAATSPSQPKSSLNSVSHASATISTTSHQALPYASLNGPPCAPQAVMTINQPLANLPQSAVVKPEPAPLLDAHGRPLPKAEAARKRAYQDLVDLTAGDDSDQDDPPPPKVPHLTENPAFAGTPAQTSAAPGAQVDMGASAPVPSKQQRSGREKDLYGKVLVEPMKREKVAKKRMYDPRTIARDILLATGRHPEMRPLNDHLMGMQYILQDHCIGVEGHKYDLSTIRWDLIDPGDPTRDSDDDRTEDGRQADDESDDLDIALRPPPRAAMSNGDGTMTLTAAPRIAFSKGRFRKKPRSRPSVVVPGVRTAAASGGTTPSTAPARSASRPSGTAAGPSSDSPVPSGSSGAIGYAAFRDAAVTYDEAGNPIRKKGRPVGWRKAIHSREAQGLTPYSSATKKDPNEPRKPRSRLPGEQADTSSPPPEAHYNEYECGWEDCGAKLHNLETLRRHVFKIHSKFPDGNFICEWIHCDSVHQKSERKGKGPQTYRQSFDKLNKWVTHIENEHIKPIARSLGDGPRSGLSDAYDSEASQAYLSDSAGRIITPRVTPLVDRTAQYAAQSEILAPVLRTGMPRVRGILSHEQEEDERSLQYLESKKMNLGPGWERDGARLATNKRQQGLYDDEDFEGDFSADDGPP